MKKRILSILLVLAMVVSLLSTAAMALDVGVFEDVNEQTDYYEYVADVLEKEYFIGMSHDPYTYEPNTLLSYAMLYTVLHRLADEEAVDGDGKEVTWYDPHVDWAKAVGLAAAGITDAKLAEAVNAAGMIGTLNGFVDGYYANHEDPSVLLNDADAVKAMIETWCETDTYTRAQAAMIIVELDKALNALKEKEEEQGDDPNDFIRAAVKGIVADFNAYAEKGLSLNVGTDEHNFTIGNFLTTLNAELGKDAVVNVSATGELYSATVEKVIAMAVEYAIAILGDEVPPTVDEVKDVVIDVADSVGVELPGNTVVQIAKDIYDRVRTAGVNVFSNFRNYNGNFCINKISLMHGDSVVASVNVTNDKGLTTDGADASKSAAISLAAHIARAMYADLKTQGAEPTSTVTLRASVVVEFGTDCPGYTGEDAKYDNSYVLNLALTLSSDMFSYSYDAETNMSTLTLIVTEGLQDEYYNVMTNGISAVVNNETLQHYLDIVVDKAIAAGALNKLYELAGEENKASVDNAVDAWIAANSHAGNSSAGAYSPFDYLWLYEGSIVANGDGTYALAQGKGNASLGINDALYDLITEIYTGKVDEQFDEVFNSVDIDTLTGMDFIDGVYELLDEEYVNGKLEEALVDWKAANGESAANTASAITLYNYLIANGNANGLIVGVNDALYTVMNLLCDDIAAEAAVRALASAEEKVNEMYGAGAWSDPSIPAVDKFGFVKLPLTLELNKISALTGDFRLYVENLCLSRICGELELDGSEYAGAADEFAGSVNSIVDDKLVSVIDKEIEETGYGEYFGVDIEETVDQMIMDVVYNAEYKGITVQEAIAKALKLKTIEGISTIALGNLSGTLNNATVQKVAAKYGNPYIHYLASAIVRLPAKASISIRGVELSEAGLEAVRAAAAKDDSAAVCAAVADLLAELGNDMCIADFADGEVFTIKYGERTFAFELAIVIE